MAAHTPDMPVPEINDIELVFGTTKALPKYEDVPEEFKRGSNLYVRAVSGLFFHGGLLSEYGLKVRDGLDALNVHRAISAHLCSWEPKHEHKEAGVALMLSHCTEPLTEGKT
jgi:hypothetical protein